MGGAQISYALVADVLGMGYLYIVPYIRTVGLLKLVLIFEFFRRLIVQLQHAAQLRWILTSLADRDRSLER